ncbi:hypothetical protein D3C72_2220990 [compost metagenome]
MTSTAIAFSRALEKFPGSIAKYHTRNVTTAMPITTGTKIPEITSATRWIGAFEP